MQRAFSLVELSIVLVILGLLTGGILAGQSLIRAAELRAVSTEFGRYMTAAHTFRDKYLAFPGDMLKATSFWGDRAECADAAIANGTPGTCNGNGDGRFDTATGASLPAESFQFWQHLALAGLIEGSYSPLAGSSGTLKHVMNVNAPGSRLSRAGWGIYSWIDRSGDAMLFDGSYGANFLLGGDDGTQPDRFNRPLLKPEEMWGVDMKLDDGKPATGTLVPRDRVGCALDASGSAMTTAAGDAAKMDAVYNLANNAIACALVFRNLF